MCNVLPYASRFRLGRCVPLIGTLCLLLSGGCDSGTAPSIYDPDRSALPDPVIESIVPEGSALAGVDIVTITGNNFSAEPANNLVYFEGIRGELLESSPTDLRVRPPNTPLPEIMIRVAVIGAENFSNSVTYSLEAAAEYFGNIVAFEDIFGITTDPDGNVYVSLFSDSRSVGIIRMTPEGERSQYVETTFGWADMAFGPDGYLYSARSVRALFRFQEGSGQETWVVIPNTSVRLTTLAIDENGRVWAAGKNTDIYSIAADKTVTSFPFEAEIRDLALFDGHLYAAGLQLDTGKVWRFSIDSNGQLGAADEIIDATAYGGADVFALAVTTSGHLYIGTDAADPVIIVSPGGTWEPLYPGILESPANRFAWGPSGHLYMVGNRTELRDPAITRINTRREGAR